MSWYPNHVLARVTTTTTMNTSVHHHGHHDSASASPSQDEPPLSPTEGVTSRSSYQPYYEHRPSLLDHIRQLPPSRAAITSYLTSLFPCASWLPHYSTRWLARDVIGGVTLGLVVVPQTMAYAHLAGLPPQFGLYTSFVGTGLYWHFGTSKDVAIGATAVVSRLDHLSPVDAVVGIGAPVALELIKVACDHLARKRKHQDRLGATVSSLAVEAAVEDAAKHHNCPSRPSRLDSE